jgi:hypothetical protein
MENWMRYRGPLLAFSVMMLMPHQGRAAVPIVLECKIAGQPADKHDLYELNYDAATVRFHSINNDGTPYQVHGAQVPDLTFRAQITDSEIKWAYQANNTFTLGRYSATLTQLITLDNGNSQTLTFQCRPYKQPTRQRQF